MEAVNLIQQTPWEINSQVKEVMEWAWDNNVTIGDIPNRKDEEFLRFQRTSRQTKKPTQTGAGLLQKYTTNLSTKSRRLLTAKVLHLAKKFEGNRFFFPSNVDWRGRATTSPPSLTYKTLTHLEGSCGSTGTRGLRTASQHDGWRYMERTPMGLTRLTLSSASAGLTTTHLKQSA